jgi:hypothetical protein
MCGMLRKWLVLLSALGALAIVAAARLAAEPPGPPEPEAEPAAQPPDDGDSGLEVTKDMIRLDPKAPVWVDRKQKQVAVDGRITLREGGLEIFACPRGTKEHEAIVAIFAKPSTVHAGLLVLGAHPGKPTQLQPKYRPATGDEVEIYVLWQDAAGTRHKVRAQEMVRDVKTKKEMTSSWVFAGSGFWKDDVTGREFYLADSGEFICLSNFPSAMLDVPIDSTDSNDSLEFQPFTEHIPPVGTNVRLILIPKLNTAKEAPAAGSKGGASNSQGGSEKKPAVNAPAQ